MRLVFDINAGDDSNEVSNDIRDFITAELARVTRTYYSFLLPAPDVYSISPLIERKYKAMLYSLAGNLLSDVSWMKIFRVLAIDFDNPYNPVMLYNEDLWNDIYPLTVGTVSSKAYDMPYNELVEKISSRYAEVNMVHEGDVDIELLAFYGEECNIYSEDIGRVITIDEIGSRVIITMLYTKTILKAVMASDSFPADTDIKVYCVHNAVFDDDDDDEIIDYEDEAV